MRWIGTRQALDKYAVSLARFLVLIAQFLLINSWIATLGQNLSRWLSHAGICWSVSSQVIYLDVNWKVWSRFSSNRFGENSGRKLAHDLNAIDVILQALAWPLAKYWFHQSKIDLKRFRLGVAEIYLNKAEENWLQSYRE